MLLHCSHYSNAKTQLTNALVKNNVGLWVGNAIRSNAPGRTAGRVTYPELDAPLRTDSSFHQRLQPEQHNNDKRRSIIENIIPDIVGDVCLDYMHVVCIGEYKKLLNRRAFGKFDNIRFSRTNITAISNYRIGICMYIPSNFVRKTRPLEELPRSKATELRLYLLYICPAAYRPFLSRKRFQHLMLLHVAIKILVNKDRCREFASYADSLLRLFVKTSVELYGFPFYFF
ncbi:hypothetical protein GHT06_013364 [Daphnia sinensis]|uniref:Uncharacterized protein n=1 Tax=Daphnia sinensis TaxID=1820382 RepID=A0AAD5Q0K4_9CRUS|nr:hypothetical protein GHT06_013364 [Daphnia sinensis]